MKFDKDQNGSITLKNSIGHQERDPEVSRVWNSVLN